MKPLPVAFKSPIFIPPNAITEALSRLSDVITVMSSSQAPPYKLAIRSVQQTSDKALLLLPLYRTTLNNAAFSEAM